MCGEDEDGGVIWRRGERGTGIGEERRVREGVVGRKVVKVEEG